MKTENELIQEMMRLGYNPLTTGYQNETESEKGNYNFRYWNLPMDNGKLKGGPFYYERENDFAHLTSLDKLFAILESKTIRLYNLINMDDRFEMEYGVLELGFPSIEQILEQKKDLFCISMCSFNELDNDIVKEHLLWRLYGSSGNGVILRLAFKNDRHFWQQYHLSEVYYDTNQFQNVKELHSFKGRNYFDPKIASFLKRDIYSFENEARLIFDNRKNNVTATVMDKDEKIIYPIIKADNKNPGVSFLSLPLTNFYQTNAEFMGLAYANEWEYKIPKISIEEIILGYRFSKEQHASAIEKIRSFDSSIKVSTTKLRKYY